MKFATWNVNSLTVRLPQVIDWLNSSQVDVLALQELKMVSEKFPHTDFEDIGYQSFAFGQKTYNGVALLVKTGLAVSNVMHNNPCFEDEQARIISADVAGIQIVGAYFPNGQEPGSEKFAYKMRWLGALETWLGDSLKQNPKHIVMGDYNVAPEDRDSYDPIALKDTIHHTVEERAHFQAMLDLGFHDAFRLFEQAEKSFSWWDYREMGFRRGKGLRIDHILVSNAIKDAVNACTIDKAPRKNERPSDHTPVIAELTI